MRFILAALLILAPLSAHAQFKSYFDISALRIVALAEPDWSREQEGDRVRYPRTKFRALPAADRDRDQGHGARRDVARGIRNRALTPARLRHDGENDAKRTNSRFLLAEPVTVEGRKGVQMEASAQVPEELR